MKQHFIILVFLVVLIASSLQLVQVQGSRKLIKDHHHYRLSSPPKVNAGQEQQRFNVSNSKFFAQNQNKSISSTSNDDASMLYQAYSGPSQKGRGH